MSTSSTRHAVVDTTIGPLTVVVDEIGLAGVYFPGHWTNPDRTLWGPEAEDDPAVAVVAEQLRAYLAGERTTFDLPLHLVGSARARELWNLLLEIPAGTTTTYGALAARMGEGISPRAVGGYVGHNPVSIVVPCHRVVGASGSLTGYAGGLERKRHLLELEGALEPDPVSAGLW